VEKFVIRFGVDVEPDDGLIVQPAIDVEHFEAESFEQAVCQVADRIRAFDFGSKTVVGLSSCLKGYGGAA